MLKLLITAVTVFVVSRAFRTWIVFSTCQDLRSITDVESAEKRDCIFQASVIFLRVDQSVQP